MTKILGLDLGTNSIGWSIIDKEKNKINDSGVRIFPMGVNHLNEGQREQSKNAERREKRQQRRQYARKRFRKIKLLELLIEQNMCPLTYEKLMTWKHWDKTKKSAGRHFPKDESFYAWLKMEPYELRNRGVNGELNKMEFGRLLYHFVQRRGFLSSRKEKEAGKIYEGKENMTGIDDTKAALNGNTLGEYLYSIVPKEKEAFQDIRDQEGNDLRARARYTLRDMYVEEFERIWKQQADKLGLNDVYVTRTKTIFLSGSKTRNRNQRKIDYLKKHRDKVEVEEIILPRKDMDKKLTRVISYEKISLHDHLAGKIELQDDRVKFDNKDSVLFYQRPLRSQKNLLGKCRYESNKTPAALSHPDYETFRAWQFVNTIKFGNNYSLPLEQKKLLVDFIKTKKSSFKFSELIKKLNMSFENFNYQDDDKVEGCPTIANLSKLFSKEGWEKHYHEIWHDFYFFDDTERLYKKLKASSQYGLATSTTLDKIEKIKLKDGYASLSLKAIRNILYFLEKGFLYNQAVILGGVMNAFNYQSNNDDINRWERFSDFHDTLIKDVIDITKERNKEGETIVKIKDYLSDPENQYGFKQDDRAFKKLYHHSQEIKEKENLDKIPEVENLRNPIVQRSVQEMRRLVNQLMKEYGKFDRIAVEMGRDLKLGKTARDKINQRMRENLNKNEKVRETLKEYNLKSSRANVQKVLMFNEIKDRAGKVLCPYTGKTINISDLLGKDNKVQIEHIIPRSYSLDDSFANKTLCDAKFNQLKGNLTPFEFYTKNSDKKLWGASSWDEIEQRAYAILPFNKAKRFTTKNTNWKTEEFISQQLNDERYISKKTKEVLSHICDDVVMMPGAVTSELRRLWGLNNILQPVKGIEEQNVEVNPDKPTNYWAITDENNRIKGIYPVQNPRPDTAADETIITGYIRKEKFTARRLNLELDANGLPDGAYYAKLKVTNPKELLKQYVDKPDSGADEIILRGKIAKGKFNHDSLPKKVAAPKGLDEGNYYARFKILNTKFETPEKQKRPENKKGLCLFGKVENHVFKSYIYQCETNLENGKYWILLDLDMDDVEFISSTNEKPPTRDNEMVLLGDINQEGTFTSLVDIQLQYQTQEKPGRYWAVVNILSPKAEYKPFSNPEPKPEKGEQLVEGKVWADKSTGEIKFDPLKNRDDHRHHAIDAIAIALTDRNIVNQLNRYQAQKDEYEKNKSGERPYFEEPWENFFKDAREAIGNILVSHHKDNPVSKKVSMIIEKNGNKYRSEGQAIRGQLHKDTVYGKRKAPGFGTAFHVRKPISKLEDTHIKKIVDDRVREIVRRAKEEEKPIYEKIKQLQKQRTKAGEDEEIVIDEQIKKLEKQLKNLYTLPNKRGDRVPIKKVRIRETIKKHEMLKPSQNREQYVNPRNNHHVIVYKDHEGNLKEKIVTLWEAAERKKQGEDVFILPPDAKELVTTIERNDMFILGIDKDVITGNEIPPKESINNHLYKVQKISGADYFFEFCFRKHTDSRPDKEAKKDYIYIKNFGDGKTGWFTYNPIKVELNQLGKIKKIFK